MVIEPGEFAVLLLLQVEQQEFAASVPGSRQRPRPVDGNGSDFIGRLTAVRDSRTVVQMPCDVRLIDVQDMASTHLNQELKTAAMRQQFLTQRRFEILTRQLLVKPKGKTRLLSVHFFGP